MPLYRFTGDKRADQRTGVVVTRDENDVLREVSRGQTISLTTVQVATLRELYDFPLASDPVPPSPVRVTIDTINERLEALEGGPPAGEPWTLQDARDAGGGALYVAHRAGPWLYPESCLAAYEDLAMQIAGKPIIIDLDVQYLADGTPVVMHDSTVDRTTNGTGAVSSFTPQEWRQLRCDLNVGQADGAAGTQIGPFSPTDERLRPPFVEEILERFARYVPFFVEMKSPSAAVEVAKLIRKYGLQKQILPNAFPSGNDPYGRLQPFIDMDMPVLLHSITGITGLTYAQMRAGGITDAAATDPGVLAAGITSWSGSTESRRTNAVAAKLVAGNVYGGTIPEDAFWQSGHSPVLTRDTFSRNVWPHGMIPYNTGAGGRGSISGGRWHTSSVGQGPCLQGYISPVAKSIGKFYNPATQTWTTGVATYPWSVQAKVRRNGSTDKSVWIAIGADTDARFIYSAGDGGTGYIAELLVDGSLKLWRHNGSTNTQLGSTAASAAIPADGEAVLKLEFVSATSVRLTRVDTGTVITQTDGNYRGGYVHFGATAGTNGGNWSFSEVAVA